MNTHNSNQQARDLFDSIIGRLHVLFQDIVELTKEQKEALYVNGSVVPNKGKAAVAKVKGQKLIFGTDDTESPAYFVAAEDASWVVTMIHALNGITTVYYDGISQDDFETTFGDI